MKRALFFSLLLLVFLLTFLSLLVAEDTQNQATFPELLAQAEQYYLSNNFDKVIDTYRKALTLDPSCTMALNNLGNIYMELGRLEEAIESLKQAVLVDPSLAAAFTYFLLGDTYYRMGLYEEAAGALEKHAVVRKVNEPVYRIRGFSYLYLHRGEEAANDARACLKMVGWGSSSSQYMALLGYFGFRMSGQTGEARQILQEVTHSADTSAWPFPVIRYLKREIKLDQLLARTNSNNERTEARCYVGLDLLLSDLKEEALEHFRWVEEYGNRDFVEYRLALAEIARAKVSN